MQAENETGNGLGRVSRYRSQRRKNTSLDAAAAAPPPPVPALPPPDDATMNTIQRSRSRYRHARPVVSAGAVPAMSGALESMQPVSMTDGFPRPTTNAAAPGTEEYARASSHDDCQEGPTGQIAPSQGIPHKQRTGRSTTNEPSDEQPGVQSSNTITGAEAETQERLAAEAERHRKAELRVKADRQRARARLDAEYEQSQQQRASLDALEGKKRAGAGVDATPFGGMQYSARQAHRQQEVPLAYRPSTRGNRTAQSPPNERRLRGGPTTTTDDHERTPDMSPSKGLSDSMRGGRVSDATEDATSSMPKLQERGGQQSYQQSTQNTAGIGPGIDAPISAVNAGERHVRIEIRRTGLHLPVTSTTTALDLIGTILRDHPVVASQMNSDPTASVLLEYFGKVGVQRPLRHYEHVRSVLNSWDTDAQNSLILVPAASPADESDLAISSVPGKDSPPSFQNIQMYHSQRLGHWTKKSITLHPTGQLTISSSSSSSLTQKPEKQTPIAHLTDFDIYTPHPRQLSRKIKPPKKICFAVKSQQKSAMFLSLDNYVHFFCTNDKATAALFWRGLSGWRARYLVHTLGEGQTTTMVEGETTTTTTGQLNRGMSRRRPSTSGPPAPATARRTQPSSRTQNPPSAYRARLPGDDNNTTTNTHPPPLPPSSTTHDHQDPTTTITSLNRRPSQQHRPSTSTSTSSSGVNGALPEQPNPKPKPKPKPTTTPHQAPPPLPLLHNPTLLPSRKPTSRHGLKKEEEKEEDGFMGGGLVGLIPADAGRVIRIERGVRGREVRVGTGEGIGG